MHLDLALYVLAHFFSPLSFMFSIDVPVKVEAEDPESYKNAWPPPFLNFVETIALLKLDAAIGNGGDSLTSFLKKRCLYTPGQRSLFTEVQLEYEKYCQEVALPMLRMRDHVSADNLFQVGLDSSEPVSIFIANHMMEVYTSVRWQTATERAVQESSDSGGLLHSYLATEVILTGLPHDFIVKSEFEARYNCFCKMKGVPPPPIFMHDLKGRTIGYVHYYKARLHAIPRACNLRVN